MNYCNVILCEFVPGQPKQASTQRPGTGCCDGGTADGFFLARLCSFSR